MNNAPIGIFDSGLGGLTVARAVIDKLPDEEIIYLGDTEHTPYGPRAIAQVRSLTLSALDELASRGVPFEVAPRGEVLDRALVMAERLADKPRRSLITLKAHLVRHLLEQLPHCTELELAMHEITIHEPEVRERLISRYSA